MNSLNRKISELACNIGWLCFIVYFDFYSRYEISSVLMITLIIRRIMEACLIMFCVVVNLNFK